MISPAAKTVDYIRNFASSLRIVEGLPSDASSFRELTFFFNEYYYERVFAFPSLTVCRFR